MANHFKISNKTYDRIKGAVLYVLPGLTTLILTLGTIWEIPAATPVAATVGAVTIFLGAAVGVAKSSYEAGQFSGSIPLSRAQKNTLDAALENGAEDYLRAVADVLGEKFRG